MGILEETRNEWLEDMHAERTVTKREKRKKFKKKELFKRELNELKYRNWAIVENEEGEKSERQKDSLAESVSHHEDKGGG